MTNESEMLGSIRAALGRESITVTPEPLPPFRCDDQYGLEADPVERFGEELRLAGGTVSPIGSPDDVKDYLKKLLPLAGPVTVAVSDSAATRHPWLYAWLKALHVRVVPSFKQFIEALGDDDAATGRRHQSASAKEECERALEKYKDALLEADLGVTLADHALADTGTLVLVSGGEQHRLISLLPPVHVCLLEPARILASLSALMRRVQNDRDWQALPPLAMTLITGPSRTADIEQTITNGVHGPREVHVLLCSQ
jgi:hypothetical protein